MEQVAIIPVDMRFLAGCAGKDRYPTAASAEAVCRLMHRGKLGHRISRMDAELLEAYECDYCGFWHLGHGP
jgi:hypothetical protein